ncbi:MAG: sulfite exporter TauE/SafE family protein [Candidatus Desulfofervidus sp.]|nr:sulfite exporter TauE/SafE family protein [Candidatus Desulfofervidus sp.]
MKLKSVGKCIGKGLMKAGIAQAQWEYEMSQNILNSKKRMIILTVLAILPIIVGFAFADQLPVILGGKKAYAPAYFLTKVLGVAIGIGLMAGLITGCIGAGGGFVITPALMSAGVKGIMAVGTDMFHIFAKAIMGTVVHKKLGNVSIKLAVAFVVGSFLGVNVGAAINKAIYTKSPVMSDAFISFVYVVLLGFLGFYALTDFLKLRRAAASGVEVSTHGGGEGKKAKAATELATTLQSVPLPPRISFDKEIVPGGRKIWAGFVAGCGFIVGVVAAIMGVGGGFLTFPMFVYILGVSSFTTVGTDIFQIIFTAGYASVFKYAIYGFVFYSLAMGLLIGSLLGIQIGALTTKVVPGLYIRGFYALAIIAGFFNRFLALPGKLTGIGVMHVSKATSNALNMIGVIGFFVLISFFGIWVLMKFFANLKTLKEG